MHIYIYIYIYLNIYICIYMYTFIGIMVLMFTNGPGDWGSILGQVIPKNQKMLLDSSLLNTQPYKIWINSGEMVAPSATPH